MNISASNEKRLGIQQSNNACISVGLNILIASGGEKKAPISSNEANGFHRGWKAIFNNIPDTLLLAAPKYPVTPTTPWMFAEYDILVAQGRFLLFKHNWSLSTNYHPSCSMVLRAQKGGWGRGDVSWDKGTPVFSNNHICGSCLHLRDTGVAGGPHHSGSDAQLILWWLF